MKKNFLLLIVFLFSFVQIKSQEIEIVADEDVEVEEEIVIEKPKTNTKYKTYRINDTYDLYYDKYSDSYYTQYGILKNGKKLLPNIFRKSGYGYESGKVILGINRVYGLFDVSIESWTIPILYEELSVLSNGLYKAKLGSKFGIIDVNNNVIEDFKWKTLKTFYYSDKNYFLVSEVGYPNYNYGILNLLDKKLTIPCKYQDIDEIKNTNSFRVKLDGKYNIVNINNEVKFTNWYEQLYLPSGGRKLFIVKKGDKMGVIDESENQVVPIEYMKIESSPYRDGSYLAQNKEGKYGCITLDGRVTLPFLYTKVNKNYNDNIIAMREDKCGLVKVNDGMPYEIATCDYTNIDGHKDVFIVEKDGKLGMLDMYGKLVTKLEYDAINPEYDSYYSKKKLFSAKKGKKYFLLNSSGELVSQVAYKSIKRLVEVKKDGSLISDFSFFKVQKIKSEKFGLVDLFGKEVLTASFDDIITKQGEIIIVIKDKMFGIYDIIKKQFVIPAEYNQLMISKKGFIGMKGNDFYQITIAAKAKVEKL